MFQDQAFAPVPSLPSSLSSLLIWVFGISEVFYNEATKRVPATDLSTNRCSSSAYLPAVSAVWWRQTKWGSNKTKTTLISWRIYSRKTKSHEIYWATSNFMSHEGLWCWGLAATAALACCRAHCAAHELGHFGAFSGRNLLFDGESKVKALETPVCGIFESFTFPFRALYVGMTHKIHWG